MSNPNTDRDERVRQIRERLDAVRYSPIFAKSAVVTMESYQAALRDVDTLLSLLDSQVAAQPIGWISCGLRHGHDRIVDVVFENADCAKAFIDGVEPVAGPIVAATRMRDRCVEKVKRRAAKRLKEAAEVEEDDYEYSRALECAGNQLEEVASELQSLILEQGEQRQ